MSATIAERKSNQKLVRLLKSGSNPGDISLNGISSFEALALVVMIDSRLDKEKPKLVKLENSFNEQKRLVDGLRKLRTKAGRKSRVR